MLCRWLVYFILPRLILGRFSIRKRSEAPQVETEGMSYTKCVSTVNLEMAKGEKEEINQADNVISYFKSLTLEKKYGTTGSIEMEHGAVYIGDKSFGKKIY